MLQKLAHVTSLSLPIRLWQRLPDPLRRWRVTIALVVMVAAWSPTGNAAFAQDTTPIPPRSMYLPAIQGHGPEQRPCPATSTASYDAIPIVGSPRQAPYPPVIDPDLNLVVRSYVPTNALLDLVEYGGDPEPAPRLHTLFAPPRVPAFTAAYRVHHWDWECPSSLTGWGCRSDPLTTWDVTLIAMQTAVGEPITVPDWTMDIYVGVYRALVLYAEPQRMTLTYLREDSLAHGYAVHIEDFCVDPNLLALYEALDAAGRTTLPALRSGDRVGEARVENILVAIRDRGSFMDPRAGKDWWQGR